MEDPSAPAESPEGTIVAAGVLSAAHSELDPPMGEVIETSDRAAILGVLAEGHGVTSPEASALILARKAQGLATVLRLREEGASIPDLLLAIAAAGASWGT